MECYGVTFFVFRFFRFFSQKKYFCEKFFFGNLSRSLKIQHFQFSNWFSEKKTKKSKNKKRHVIAFHVTEPLQKTKKDSIKNPARTIHLIKIKFSVRAHRFITKSLKIHGFEYYEQNFDQNH